MMKGFLMTQKLLGCSARFAAKVSLSLLLLTCSAAQAQRLSVVSVGQSLGWMSFDLASGQTTQVGEFGAVGDHLAPGMWLGTGSTQIAVTSVQRDSGTVMWRVFNSSGSAVVEQSFGRAGQIAISAVDVDKTGIADPIMVGLSGRKFKWEVAYDLFRGGTKRQSFVHGFKGESPFFINPDGAGDLLATFTSGKGGATVRLLNPRTKARSIIRRLPKMPNGAQAPLAVPITGPDGKQRVLVSRVSGSRTLLALYDLKTKSMSTATVNAVGDVVVGDLRSNPGQEVAVGRSQTVNILNLFDGSEIAVSVPNGVLVDGININLMSSQQSNTPQPSPTSAPPAAPPVRATPVPGPQPTPGNSPPSSASLQKVCANVSAIAPSEMLIKSEPSNHIHGGDPRTTGYTVVCAQRCPKNLGYAQFFYADGTFAGAVAKYGNFSGNGQPRLYGAVGQAPQHFASEIAQKAATIGNGKLYLQMSAATEGAGTDCKEFAPSGRNGSLY